MGQRGENRTRRTLTPLRAAVCVGAGAAVSAAHAGSITLPLAMDYESALVVLADASMRTTHGPTAAEGAGLLRFDAGLEPPATIDLDLPPLRSASPLDALRWSNRWRELIESVYGGEREMVSYWAHGVSAQGDPMFSVLRLPDGLDERKRAARLLVNAEPLHPHVTRPSSYGRGGASGGGGGGGGGGRSPLLDLAPGGAPIIDPGVITPPMGNDPSTDPGAPNSPGGPGSPADPTEPVRRPIFVIGVDDIEWINPSLNQNPPPTQDATDDNPFDGESPTGVKPLAPIAIPTPTAVGLGAAGLLALGARMRRRGLV